MAAVFLVVLMSFMTAVTAGESMSYHPNDVTFNVGTVNKTIHKVVHEYPMYYRLYVVVDSMAGIHDEQVKDILEEANKITSSTSNIHLQVTGLEYKTMPPFAAESWSLIFESAKNASQTLPNGYDIFLMLYNNLTFKPDFLVNLACFNESVQTLSIKTDKHGSVDKQNVSQSIADAVKKAILDTDDALKEQLYDMLADKMQYKGRPGASLTCLRKVPEPKASRMSLLRNGVIETPEACDCHAHEAECETRCVDGKNTTKTTAADSTSNSTKDIPETELPTAFKLTWIAVVSTVIFFTILYTIMRFHEHICSGNYHPQAASANHAVVSEYETSPTISEVSSDASEAVLKGIYSSV